MIQHAKCKICRRLGDKLFLKGEKCSSAKCTMIKRPFAPGQKAKKRRSALSDFGKEMREKQRMRKFYGVSESQFKKYVEQVTTARSGNENVADELIQKIESRLDNIIFRLGWCRSRSHASQLVSHGHFAVNGRKVDIPSYFVSVGDVISIRPGSRGKDTLKDLDEKMKKYSMPAWLSYDKEKMEGKFVKKPMFGDIQLPAEIAAIFEHYSR
ncbi:MAG: 30S ribosomal protein S4 [Candidatus Paceibacterota bacterium]|jgi:small subunit ribosomal protein S4